MNHVMDRSAATPTRPVPAGREPGGRDAGPVTMAAALNAALAVRKVTELTLAFDHRVCDDATAGGFLRYIADCVESPGGRTRRPVTTGITTPRRAEPLIVRTRARLIRWETAPPPRTA
jgi:hypothetical protein